MRIFISYHRANSNKVDDLIEILREKGYDYECINENHDFDGKTHDHIAKICLDTMEDCDITICVVGKETYQRSHVDHELKATLRGGLEKRKGLIAVLLEERGDNINDINLDIFPNRIQDIITVDFDYVVLKQWSSFNAELDEAIDEANSRRTNTLYHVKNNRKLMQLRKGKYYNQTGDNED